jgi:hypothetical protein
MTDLVGIDSIVAELRACTEAELPGVRESFAAVASDPDETAGWRALAEAAVVAIDRMAGGIDPGITLGGLELDLMAADQAELAGRDGLGGSRSRARRRRRGSP